VPDMIYTANIPISKYAGKGILEDLWPYIESDTRFGRDDLVESVFKAVEIDGKLYQTVSSFSVTTALGLTDVVGDKLGWTLDDLKAALNTLPEGAQVFNDTATKSDILNGMISMNMSTYIDWTTGECKFDTEDFISLLNFTAGFADDDIWDDYDWNEYEDDYTRMKSGKQLLYRVYLYGFDSMSELQASLGKDVTFVGYPTDSGYGAAFSLNDGIAMTTSCSNKDVAWAFMGTFLTADYQQENSWSFCTNKEVFEQQAKDAMTQEYDSDGNPIPLYSYGRSGAGDTVTDVYAITQEMYEAVLEVINNTTMVSSYDQEIIDIITDETAAFFEGQKTAEETAKMLQSRISLYVGEQM
jgi:ABC-type glycerol-3-phosphate transport system substrate-binding protein